MADSRLDKQLDHVLTEYCLVIGVNHKVRQMFKENDLYQFEDFVICDTQSLTGMERKNHNTTVGFVHRKRTQIYNVIIYYKFLQSDNSSKKLAKD